ncbi:HlyD family efflux transporter periplasmic adaptor subunit, partial [Vibrio hyugaensis]|uniref:HlyD family efflux transporter periplasmic adaptor subunit n=1 Tax=Vibrio hyugaensis TaxID=1534743 RepID=UPI0011AFD3CB
MSLFRKEVRNAHLNNSLGDISICLPVKYRLFCLLCIMFVLLGFSFLIDYKYERKLTLEGILFSNSNSETIFLEYPMPTPHIHVSVGDHVIKGQLLATINESYKIDSTMPSYTSNKSSKILAKNDGVVTFVNKKTHENLFNSQPLIHINYLSNSRIQGKIEVSKEDVIFINEGERVELRFWNFPYQKFGTIHADVEKITSNFNYKSNSGSKLEKSYT